MSIDNALREELLELAVVCSAGVASAEQFARLEQLLDASEESRAFYVDSLDIHANLYIYGSRWQQQAEKTASQPDGMGGNITEIADDEEVSAVLPASISAPAAPCVDPSTLGHHRSSVPNLGYAGDALGVPAGQFFTSGWPAAYLVAMLIVGAGLLAGSFIHVSQPLPIAIPSRSSTPVVVKTGRECVGRITGMVDCQWVDASTAPVGCVGVPLGRKYALRSGLLEITYDTGARVILQGPATYEVASAAGGFLSFGKLTARVESRGERREERGERVATSSNPKSQINKSQIVPPSSLSSLPYPLFSVRTPAAVVTDLGTEFGVDVDEAGATTAHVFRGAVNIQLSTGGKSSAASGQVLAENQSARVGAGQPHPQIELISCLKPSRFIRELPRQTIVKLDLVDIVAGGDGHSGHRNRCVNCTTGQLSDRLAEEPLQGDGRYHGVPESQFVDGVFIPGSGRGPVQTDSVGHTVGDLRVSDGRTIGGVWAIGGGLKVHSWVGLLPRKASDEFTHKCEMDGEQCMADFTMQRTAGSGKFIAADGNSVLDLSSTLQDVNYFVADAPGSIWPGKFSRAVGYTLETRVKVISSQGEGPFMLGAATPEALGQHSWLSVDATGETWGVGASSFRLGQGHDNTAAFHTFRIAQRPGAARYCVWRDSVLLSETLSANSSAGFGPLDRLVFGDPGSKGWGGEVLVDYVRFTPGAYAPAASVAPTRSETAGNMVFTTKLGAVDYAAPGRGALVMHANAGVTLNLAAIRRANPRQRVLRFCAMAGVAETESAGGGDGWADFRVLVDGQPRFTRREINRFSGDFQLVVSLDDGDRFLTLLATDGGDGIGADWILLGDPRLELSKEEESSAKPK